VNEKQYKRMMRAFTLSLFLLWLIILIVLYLITHIPKQVQVNNYLGRKGDPGSPGQSIIGPQGLSGIGLQGIPGQDGQVINNVTIQNVPVVGPTGEKGDIGPSGRELIIQIDITRCVLQSQYQGDDAWTDLAQLPKPCEVQ
jgi:hypothetical protein